MNELTSYKIHLNQQLTTNEILNIHHYVANNECDVYLHQNHLIADAGNVTKLLSFFLLADTQSPIKMIIDGECVDHHYDQLSVLWEQRIEKCDLQTKYDHSITNNISIVV